MGNSKTVVCLFLERQSGAHETTGDSYDLEDLGGEIPAVGDLIVDPGVVQGRDRNDPANRSVYEVAVRYFLPRTTDEEHVFVNLLVRERQGQGAEINILGP